MLTLRPSRNPTWPPMARFVDLWEEIQSSNHSIGGTVDPELTSLAQTAGTTLVTLMTTEAWQHTRERFTRLWQRLQPDRARIISGELDASREEVLRAHSADDQEMLSELRQQWEGCLRRLLLAHPEVVEELRGLLDEFSPDTAPGAARITQRATASGRARIYQAGRDMHINER
ncbi:hypothetical protein [Streptomyces sp. NPDC093097]|uniref:hypothetical protein n=1 Tax=Streptomyces sp. NPDC093097 TaxID=3366027 RepID=UPI00380EA65A